MNFNETWNRAVNLYRALDRKGTLVLSGASPEVEVAYVYYDDFVTLAVGTTAQEAVEAFIDKLSEEARQKAAALMAEAAEKSAKLISVLG